MRPHSLLDFVEWIFMNFESSKDFLQDIMNKHGDLKGEHASLSEIVHSLDLGGKNTLQFKKFYEDNIFVEEVDENDITSEERIELAVRILLMLWLTIDEMSPVVKGTVVSALYALDPSVLSKEDQQWALARWIEIMEIQGGGTLYEQ